MLPGSAVAKFILQRVLSDTRRNTYERVLVAWMVPKAAGLHRSLCAPVRRRPPPAVTLLHVLRFGGPSS